MTKEIGTLAEIGAKPGDTVKLVENGVIAGMDVGKLGVVIEGDDGDLYTRGDGMNRGDNCRHKFQIVSRAPDKPKLWRDMTPEEKGALLLAQHEGKVIQSNHTVDHNYDDWNDCCPVWCPDAAYRIRPKPKIETVHLMNFHELAKGHAIVFTVKDGEPDCTSIKMEKL